MGRETIATTTPSLRGARVRVLLVEDEDGHAELVRRAFEGERGFCLEVATSVARARVLRSEWNPDVILADLMLPDGRGIDLLQDTGEESPPLVLLTSHGDETVAVEAIKSGALDYIVKSPEAFAAMPSIAARVFREWRHVLDRRRAEAEVHATVHALRELHRIVAASTGFDDKVAEVLKLGCACLGLTTGAFTRPRAGGREIRAVFSRHETPSWIEAASTVPGLLPVANDGTALLCIENLGATDLRDHPLHCEHQVKAYAGIDVQVGGDAYGTLSFSDSVPRSESFGATAAELLKLMGQWLGGELWRQSTVSALREAERKFQHAQRLEAVARLASGVAHDYNNLLMGIGGCVDIALKELHDPSTARLYLEEAKQAARRGSTLTRQLLDFTRKRPSEISAVDINTVIEGTRRIVESLVGEEIEVDFRLGASSWRVWTDEGQLEQVLMNLVVNARDAMPNGGKMVLETAQVTVDEDHVAGTDMKAGPYVTLSVRDSGCGMSQEVQKQIFQPFFTTKDVGKGTGLGLATVRSIIAESAGYIRLRSEPGKGTEFVIYLPRMHSSAEATAPVAAVPVARQGGTETILLVEDEPLVRITLARYLVNRGYRVLEACDSEQALELVRAHTGPLDLVLTDMMLPGRSGRDVVRDIKQHHASVRTIYMSAHPQPMLVQWGRVERDTPVMQKPFGEDTLLENVRRVLGPAPATMPPPAGGVIVVVEDNRPARLAIRHLLQDVGYEIIDADSPTQALERAQAHGGRIVLLLTDYSLPEKTGDQLAREFRTIWPGLRVLYMSGYADVPRDPGDDLITKPIDLDELFSKVEAALR